MKKILAISLTMIIVLAMLFTLTGCGVKETNTVVNVTPKTEENTNKNTTIPNTPNVSGTKLEEFAKLYTGENFYMKYKMTVDGKQNEVEVSKKGDKIATASVMDGVKSNVIMDGNIYYIIMHDQKMVMKTTQAQNMNEMYDESLEDVTSANITKGTETINGKNYEYEEYDTVRYYFDGKDLKYMKSEGELIEIVEISTQSKESLFNIPSDYTEMNY